MRRKKDSGSELRLGCNDEMTVIGEAVWNPPHSRVCLTFMKGFDIASLTPLEVLLDCFHEWDISG